MIRLIFPLLIGLSVSNLLDAQPRAMVSIFRYYVPEKGNYADIILMVDGSTVEPVLMDDSLMHAHMEVTYAFYKDFNDLIHPYRKFEIVAPGSEREENYHPDFFDVQTIEFRPGNYRFDMTIKDKGFPMLPTKTSTNFPIEFDGKVPYMSDIIWIAKEDTIISPRDYVKQGYAIKPYLKPWFSPDIKSIKYYAEIYNTHRISSEVFVLHSYVKDIKNDKILDFTESYRRVKCDRVHIVKGSLNLSSFAPGTYLFTVEALDKNKQLVTARGIQFYIPDIEAPKEIVRNSESTVDEFTAMVNGLSNIDTLRMYVGCLRPISLNDEQAFIDAKKKKGTVEELKDFFSDFWINRDSLNPMGMWKVYKKEVDLVNNEFGNKIERGYETDMGSVYLKYGKPNQRVQRFNEPSSYPYEIWQYYQHPMQSNAKYVFYNPDLVSNSFELLYSNVRGEANNRRWQYLLQQRDLPENNVDRNEGEEHWGGRIDDFYDNPR
ncbi:MAG TPA: hypothetical protein DDX92_05380 [Flavobacteriales bacterium]|jgi:GWxTD domain-containing protein|nr:hypothetical protein [Flavobacteriales bacterium]